MPAIPIIMPQLGESIAEATVVNLLVRVGDEVQTDQYLQETLTDRAILKIGRQVIVVVDHTKINRVATALLSPLKSVHTLITDVNGDRKFVQALKKQGIQIIEA